ncbi:unnamed protein product [Urochloa humidicola]
MSLGRQLTSERARSGHAAVRRQPVWSLPRLPPSDPPRRAERNSGGGGARPRHRQCVRLLHVGLRSPSVYGASSPLLQSRSQYRIPILASQLLCRCSFWKAN